MVIDLNARAFHGSWIALSDLTVDGNLSVGLSSSLHNTFINGDLQVIWNATVGFDLSAGDDIFAKNDIVCGRDFFCRHGTMHLNDIECQDISA